jgi:hypothetical protein
VIGPILQLKYLPVQNRVATRMDRAFSMSCSLSTASSGDGVSAYGSRPRADIRYLAQVVSIGLAKISVSHSSAGVLPKPSLFPRIIFSHWYIDKDIEREICVKLRIHTKLHPTRLESWGLKSMPVASFHCDDVLKIFGTREDKLSVLDWASMLPD